MNLSHPHGVRRAALTGLIALMLAPAALPRAHAQSLPQAPDPSMVGPYAVTKEEYEFGYTANASTSFPGYTTNTNGVVGFGGPVEEDGSVWYPSVGANSGVPATGPFPLIVFLHGRHSTAYAPTTVTVTSGTTTRTITAGAATSIWPPTAASGYSLSVPSYEGYDYASSVLASDGYVVVSIGANGINAVDAGCRLAVTATGASNAPFVTDAGALARAELIQKQLDSWKAITTTGDTTAVTNVVRADGSLAPNGTFGTRFTNGVVDMTRIGTMGHSRGGEGNMTHAVYNSSPSNPEVTVMPGGAVIPAYPIKAVLALAPIDFNRYVVNGIPTATIIPYCDGDVSDNQGIHFFDDTRYNVPTDPTPKYFWTILGADHDLGNTIWTPSLFPAPANTYPAGYGGTSEDWNNDTPGGAADPFAGNVTGATQTNTTASLANSLVITNLLPTRLQPLQQQAIERNYFIAFFRTYIGHETQFLPFLRGDAAPPMSHPAGQPIFETYQAPAALRLDVNDFVSAGNLITDAQGGAVNQSGLAPFTLVGGSSGTSDATPALRPLPGQPAARQPNNTPSNYNFNGVPGLSQLSLGWSTMGAFLENVLPVSDVSGYMALQFRAAVNFTDSRNRVLQDDFSAVLTDATGKTASVPISQFSSVLKYPPGKVLRLPKVELNAIRIPLTAFTGVDLTHIKSVRFVFDRQPMGAILLSDVTFNKPTLTTAF